jgi:WG containing repeat
MLLGLGILATLAGLTGLAVTSLPQNPPDTGPGSHGLHPARVGGKYGYADSTGALIIAARFDLADTFSEGLALVGQNGRYGYIDPRGSFAIPAEYRHALPFHDGYAAVRDGGSWMFLDREGRKVTGHPGDSVPLASREEASREDGAP